MQKIVYDVLLDAFLSTLPARGATLRAGASPAKVWNFYPRSPRGERHKRGAYRSYFFAISIHAPREGSDESHKCRGPCPAEFLSTLPARGATARSGRRRPPRPISIHAPREGSDPTHIPVIGGDHQLFLSTLPARGATVERAAGIYREHNFYPRSPRGERPASASWTSTAPQFLSTLPARGATHVVRRSFSSLIFLSTLPARGATLPSGCRPVPSSDYFYPRSPRGERRWAYRSSAKAGKNFYPRSPRGERP